MTCAGNSTQRSATKCGAATALVPRMTNRTPAWMYVSTVSSLRMPPPTCTGTSGCASTTSRTTPAFFGSPANAPSRSTTCSRRAPASTQRVAIATGSSENTVAVSMRPSRRRTHLRSLMSMAGMRSISLVSPEVTSRLPASGRSPLPADTNQVLEKVPDAGSCPAVSCVRVVNSASSSCTSRMPYRLGRSRRGTTSPETPDPLLVEIVMQECGALPDDPIL